MPFAVLTALAGHVVSPYIYAASGLARTSGSAAAGACCPEPERTAALPDSVSCSGVGGPEDGLRFSGHLSELPGQAPMLLCCPPSRPAGPGAHGEQLRAAWLTYLAWTASQAHRWSCPACSDEDARPARRRVPRPSSACMMEYPEISPASEEPAPRGRRAPGAHQGRRRRRRPAPAHCIHASMPAFICSGVALAIWSRAEAGDRYSTMNLVISSPLSGRNCPSGPIWANEMPGAMVQLTSYGNIFVLISSSRICAAPVSWTRPAVQRVARGD